LRALPILLLDKHGNIRYQSGNPQTNYIDISMAMLEPVVGNLLDGDTMLPDSEIYQNPANNYCDMGHAATWCHEQGFANIILRHAFVHLVHHPITNRAVQPLARVLATTIRRLHSQRRLCTNQVFD
jgi:hypothetical protein